MFVCFQPLTFLSLGNAYLALKNISGALEAFRQALKLTTKCPECENSLKLIRCMQFYPFLYNVTSSVCSGKQLLNVDKILSPAEHRTRGRHLTQPGRCQLRCLCLGFIPGFSPNSSFLLMRLPPPPEIIINGLNSWFPATYMGDLPLIPLALIWHSSGCWNF